MPLDAEHRRPSAASSASGVPSSASADDAQARRDRSDGLVVMARGRHVDAQRAADPAVGVERHEPVC